MCPLIVGYIENLQDMVLWTWYRKFLQKSRASTGLFMQESRCLGTCLRGKRMYEKINNPKVENHEKELDQIPLMGYNRIDFVVNLTETRYRGKQEETACIL